MFIFLLLACTIAALIILLRFKVPLGPAILLCGLGLWLVQKPEVSLLIDSAKTMLLKTRTWDLVGALYFVVCLEIELRKSGCLAGMVKYLQQLTPNKKVGMAVMPAFLGLLPSIGGARFSAPIVEKLAEGEDLKPETLGAANFWFRHIFEFSSPIVPGMILACAITNIPVGSVILHLMWVSLLAFVIGWIVILARAKMKPAVKTVISGDELKKERADFILCFTPIIFMLVLMLAFGMSAGESMGITAVFAWALLKVFHRGVSLKDVFIGALEWKLFRDVFCIFLFIEILSATGLMNEIVATITAAPLPVGWIIAILSFIVGVLTGMSQGHVAIVMPIVAALAPAGNLDYLSIALVCGVGGQMVTPTHMCLIITLNYFKSDFFKTLWPCILCELVIFTVFGLSVWLFPAA